MINYWAMAQALEYSKVGLGSTEEYWKHDDNYFQGFGEFNQRQDTLANCLSRLIVNCVVREKRQDFLG